MIIPRFQGSLEERMEGLNDALTGKSGIRLVGSSFGGLMATLFARGNGDRIARMVLLAPALNLMASTHSGGAGICVPTWIYHGADDRVIPLTEVERLSGEIFSNLRFHVVQDDHFLHKTFPTIPWDELLS